jgi:hypothetical protein
MRFKKRVSGPSRRPPQALNRDDYLFALRIVSWAEKIIASPSPSVCTLTRASRRSDAYDRFLRRHTTFRCGKLENAGDENLNLDPMHANFYHTK